ncbi:MAG TPA: AI-2E family transporter [Longimicrobiales bacterium]|jgi:predicted PurR-regulated permease PerM
MTAERDGSKEMVWTVVQGALAVLVAALFLVSLMTGPDPMGGSAALGPFVLYFVLVAVLLPFREQKGHTLVITLASLLVLFWVLDTTGFLLAPFVLALVLAYILDPLVDRLVARGMGRVVAILVLALPAVTAAVVLVLVAVPAMGQQMGELIERAPVLLERFADWLEALDERVAAAAVPDVLSQLVARMREVDGAAVVEFLQERQAAIAGRAWGAVLGLGRGLGSALSVLGYVVLTPVLTFYLLRDWDNITRGARDLIPAGRRDAILAFLTEYDRLLSRYMRGQVTVALAIGVITALGLAVTRFPYAILLGAVVAVFSVVPYLGLVLSLIPALLIALVSGSVGVSLLKVLVVYGLAQALEGAVISPRIVGDSVGLHPVWIVLALAVGGYYFGFVGLLIAVPAAVGVKLFVVRGLERYRGSRLYGGEAEGG